MGAKARRRRLVPADGERDSRSLPTQALCREQDAMTVTPCLCSRCVNTELAEAALDVPELLRLTAWDGPLSRLESAVLVALDNRVPAEVIRAQVERTIEGASE